MQNANILVIEDEAEIRELVAIILLRAGFKVIQASNALDAKAILASEKIDVIILDWMLPNLSGIDFLKQLKAINESTPQVLMMSAKATPSDIVEGLDAGASDYITKPFETAVLVARVRALLRRLNPSETLENNRIKFGTIDIDLKTYEVLISGVPIHLTISEFKILTEMGKNLGCVMSRDHFISIVQGEGVSVTGRTVDTHIFGLRKKLGSASQFIETVRGVGYRAILD